MASNLFAERCLEDAMSRLHAPPAYATLGPTLRKYAASYSAAEWNLLEAEGQDAANILLSQYAGWIQATVGPEKGKVVIRRAGFDGQEPRGTRAVAEELGISRSTVRRYERLALDALARCARQLREH